MIPGVWTGKRMKNGDEKQIVQCTRMFEVTATAAAAAAGGDHHDC